MYSRKSRFKNSLKRKLRDIDELERDRNIEDAKIAKGQRNKDKDEDDDEAGIFSDSDGSNAGDSIADGPGGILKVKKVRTSKDQILNPKYSEANIVPKLGTSSVMNGTTGQGKSTLLTNIVSSKRFYGGSLPNGEDVFAHRFLISPTAEGDDVQKKLGIEEDCTYTNLEEAPELIQVLMDDQKEKIKETSSAMAPQVLLIYDDVISNPAFMRTDQFIKSFIASRHFNLTVFVCSQSWTAVPRRCRLQAKNIFFFASPLSEVELLCQEYCPPNMTKKQFFKMVDYCTSEPYSFLYINKSVQMEDRFRKRLGEVINLKFFQSLDISRESELRANSKTSETSSTDNSLQELNVGEDNTNTDQAQSNLELKKDKLKDKLNG
jgi:hypothetical protein